MLCLADAVGQRHPFRFEIVPTAGNGDLAKDGAAKQPPNFLMDEIEARVAKTPVTFDLMAQLANDGDQTKNPTLPWTLTASAPSSARSC